VRVRVHRDHIDFKVLRDESVDFACKEQFRRRTLIADQFPSSQLELFRVSAQRVRFGQQADDVRFIRGLNHGERLRFRVFENRDRLLHTHGGKQGGVGIVQNVAN